MSKFETVATGENAGQLVRLDIPASSIIRDENAPFNYSISGYGAKLPTPYRVRTIDNVWRRVYCMCYSNSGTLYVLHKGIRTIVELPCVASELPAGTRPDHLFKQSDVDAFVTAYIECALWSTSDWSDENPDHQYESLDQFDVSDKCREEMVKDCHDFIVTNAAKLKLAFTHPGYTMVNAGHDFWLTREGHGAGFWDRGLHGGLGEKLSEAAKAHGGFSIYYSDETGFVEAN